MLIPAAQYLRTSMRFQETYLERQAAVIAEFAKGHGFRIVKTYKDPARSGLVLCQRPAMQHLLNDVLQGNNAYRSILVYDVSRWGRFQDIDEAAHYEFLCKKSGVPVYYCDEPYVNDRTPAGAIFKSMRRSQAGEFSRELSEKCFRASKHVAELGFRIGGASGYGLRRMMVSPTGRPLCQLAAGEHKYSKTNHTILVPGPKEEVALVREIFAMAGTEHIGCQDIAQELNRRGISFHTGQPWDYHDVLRMLTNPKYTGRNVWGRTSAKLQGPRCKVSPEQWTIKHSAFTPIVDNEVFNRAQAFLRNRRKTAWTDEQLLGRLKTLLARKGYLNQKLLDSAPGLPSSATYYAHFGPLRKLYPLISYRPKRGTFLKILRRDQNEKLRAQLFAQIRALFPQDITVFRLRNRRRLMLRLDNGLSISVVLCRSLKLATGEIGWKLYPTHAERDYITLLCRLAPRNDGFLDFHLFPFIERRSWYSFTSENPWFKNGKRIRRLEDLCHEAKLLSRLDERSSDASPISETQLRREGEAIGKVDQQRSANSGLRTCIAGL